MTKIHQTALIAESAVIAEDVTIGAFCIIEDNVTIGSGCKVYSHAIIKKYTRMGKNNMVYHGAIIGGLPQDISFNEDTISYTVIGDDNTFRESFTVHRATIENSETLIGNNNYFMANSHVGHDCIVRDNNIVVNGSALGGHSVLEGNCLISGLCAIHQFCKVGRFAVMSGGAVTSVDIPPFMITIGRNGSIRGINVVGLKRNGFSTQTIRTLRNVYKLLYNSANLNTGDAIDEIEKQYGEIEEVQEFINFVRTSHRGVSQGRTVGRRG